MPYREELRQEIKQAPKTLGNQLGRWAVHLDFSIARIAKSTGATRQTAYNWVTGGLVSPAYRDRVRVLLETLRASTTAEQAWRKICQQLNIKN